MKNNHDKIQIHKQMLQKIDHLSGMIMVQKLWDGWGLSSEVYNDGRSMFDHTRWLVCWEINKRNTSQSRYSSVSLTTNKHVSKGHLPVGIFTKPNVASYDKGLDITGGILVSYSIAPPTGHIRYFEKDEAGSSPLEILLYFVVGGKMCKSAMCHSVSQAQECVDSQLQFKAHMLQYHLSYYSNDSENFLCLWLSWCFLARRTCRSMDVISSTKGERCKRKFGSHWCSGRCVMIPFICKLSQVL